MKTRAKNDFLIIKNEKYAKLNQLISSEYKNYLKLITKYYDELYYFEKRINSKKPNNPVQVLKLLENQQQIITELIAIINNFLLSQKSALPKKSPINLQLTKSLYKDVTLITKTNDNNTTNLDTTSNIYLNTNVTNYEKPTEIKSNNDYNIIRQFHHIKILNLNMQKHSNETLLNQYINKERSNNLILNLKDLSRNFSKSSSCPDLNLHSAKNNKKYFDNNFIFSQSYKKKLMKINSLKSSGKCKSSGNFENMKSSSNFELSIGNDIHKNKNNRKDKNKSEKPKFCQIKPNQLTEELLRRSYYILNDFERKRRINTFYSKPIKTRSKIRSNSTNVLFTKNTN